MGKRPRRNVVLFLVEGKSDRLALQIAIPELYDQIDENIEVFFPIITEAEEEKGGDISSTYFTDKRGKKHWVDPHNIEEAIEVSFFRDFFEKEKIMPKDITEIIQIVDTDGAFIPEEGVRLNAALTKDTSPHYTEDGIECTDVEKIRMRNTQKSGNLEYLSSLTRIKVKQKSIPYSIYYFSCNLDHFIHRSANLDYRDKRLLADTFSKNYIGDTEGFVKTISEDPGAVKNMSYEESWAFIKKDMNSLKRHTNINILFARLLDEKEDIDAIIDNPTSIVSILNTQAEKAKKIKIHRKENIPLNV